MANRGRKLVPIKGNKPGGRINGPPKRKVTQLSKSYRIGLTAGERAYARLLSDPCNAPIAPGMLANGAGTSIQRYENDFLMLTGPTETSANICISPTNLAVWHGFQSSDTTNISFTSAYTFPGAGTVSTAARYRPLAVCAQIYWTGSEQTRQGLVAMGNAPLGQLPPTNLTPAELRSSMPYVARFPDQGVGIKWRPSEVDVAWRTGGSPVDSALWLQASGLPVSTMIRVRIVAVMEYELPMNLGSGTPVQNYPPPNTANDTDGWSRALQYLDKTGHWLLDNAAAIGHAAANLSGLAG